MTESRSHKKGKGNASRTEVPISGNRRLDAIRGTSAIEVERSGTRKGLDRALSRLKTQQNKSKILRVPQNHMGLALERAKVKQTKVTVTNLSKTKRKKA